MTAADWGVRTISAVWSLPRQGAQLDVLVQQINPALRASYGVGPDTAAQLRVTAGTNPHRLRTEASLAAVCGAAPVRASSGKITRHRLSRGGDRAANNALYRIALVRMSAHSQTRDYVQHQKANGRTKKEILRLLKRAIARELFRVLTRPAPIDDYSDLRPARQAKNLTLATVADHFGVPIITVSRLERGHQRNDTHANNYRQWLTAACRLTRIGASRSIELRAESSQTASSLTPTTGVALAGPMSCMFGDPPGGESLHRGDALSQTGSDGFLEFAAHQRDFDLHSHGAAQL
jgi:Transposase IS116/IS110/IS902 family